MSAKSIFYSQLSLALGVIVCLILILISVEGVNSYLIEEQETLIYLGVEQLKIFSLSGSIAIIIAFWTGVGLSKKPLYDYFHYLIQIFNISMAVPTLAVLALAMIFFGIGFFSACFALVLITLMPIVCNTFNAFCQIEPSQIEAAKGMGMTGWQIFYQVEFPQALPLVFNGIRTGLIFNIGSLPLIFLISAESLGELIFIGLRLDDFPVVLIGSALTALIAISFDIFIHITSHLTISKGITQTA